MSPIETYLAVRGAELSTALSRLKDALYWADSAMRDARRVYDGDGGSGFAMSQDVNLAAASVKQRRDALKQALKLATELGVDDKRVIELLGMAGVTPDGTVRS